MGKGDKKTRKGKIKAHSYGKARTKTVKKATPAAPVAKAKAPKKKA